MHGFFYAYAKNGLPQKIASEGSRYFPVLSEFGFGSCLPKGAGETFGSSGMELNGPDSLILGSPMDQRASLYGDPSPFGYATVSVDRNAGEISVGRDQMGITPAYYYCDSETLLVSNFQSPIVEFLKLAGKELTIDRQSFYEGFSFKTTPPDRTLFESIIPVPFGSVSKFSVSGNGEVSFVGSEKEFPIDFTPHG
ncbi:MAG: hypothetical protein WA194_00440, partial [Patescibacteria group bacterium]